MSSIQFKIYPAPQVLQADVECFRLCRYEGNEALAIKVSLNGTPGLVFQQPEAGPTIKNITALSGRHTGPTPTLFVYGQNTERTVMQMAEGPFTMLQVIFKPHGLNTLLGLKASELTNSSLQLNQLVGLDLYSRLLEVNEAEKSIRLLAGFLTAQQKRVKFRDKLVEESLNLIRRNIATVSVRSLLQELGLSERQFEKRFTHSVGLTPQFYIRIKRFNEAVRLLKTGRSESLTAVAQSLNFYDQSHFIRDIREFAGVTPKRIAAKLDDFHHPQAGYSYL